MTPWLELRSEHDTSPQQRTGDLFATLSHFRSGGKSGSAWIPVDASGRGNAKVSATTALVVDSDDATAAQFAETRRLIEAAGLDCLIHSTRSYTTAAPKLRIVFLVSRPIRPHEWPTVRALVIERFKIQADPTTGDLGRIYFKPTLPADGSKPLLMIQRGEPIDVDALLEGVELLPAVTLKPAKTSAEWIALLGDLSTGNRDAGLCRVAGLLFRSDLPASLAAELLHCVNIARCKPPLSFAQVDKIAGSIARREAARCAR